ncbi:MAG: ATP-binding cassette domain-containing protein [Chloroflexi bacterium]|nr:ATP-binding cassette domain-containing protein [Ktedonobacteraceae bacterium]MBV9707946.1 ATP-binding cassette domain-containing protein [Chloroflexota bacterium]
MQQEREALDSHRDGYAKQFNNKHSLLVAENAQATQPIITVDRLVKRYKRAEINAVDGVSFTVASGTLFALLGPNGAGKTTIISILTTTLNPTSGGVIVAGYDVVKQASAVRDNVGIIFQKPSLDLNLTAEENVRFHATLYGLYPFRPSYSMMPRAYREQVQELAKVLGIEGELFRPVKKYSGGMKRKLEILRSLLHRPGVLFLDEPTSGLDPTSRRSLWEYLKQVREQHGTTVFLTTHYLEEAEQADSICIINKGRVVSYGTPAQVKAELVEEYLLIDAQDRTRLRTELQQLNLAFEQTPLFKVPLNGGNIHQMLKAIETPLTVVETHTPTVEDAYIEIVGEKR